MPSTAQAATVSEAEARLRDGTCIAYTLHRRDDSAARAVLIHSLAMDRSFWQPVAETLAARASLLVYDCRGHGASDAPAGPYTVERFADDLAELMDQVGWQSAAIAGASMGGCITLAFGAAYPARAAALGLIDTTAWYGPQAPAQWAERGQRARDGGLGALVEFQTTRWFGDAFRAGHPDVVEHSVSTFLRNDVDAYVETCRMLGACDLRAALPGMAVPACVIVGEEDYATPIAMAEVLHRGIKGSTLSVLAGGRHLTPLEQPERVAAELSRLLDRACPG